MIRALGVDDQTLTVTGVEDLTPGYRRIHFHSPRAFDGFDPEPASWARIWVPDPGDADREVQRAYTFVNADRAAGTFSLDFVLHHPPGPATAWAMAAEPGHEIRASLWASTKFTPPEVEPAGYLLLGDLAGLPGLRAVVAAIPHHVPIELYLEEHHSHDRLAPMPVHPNLRVHWVGHDDDWGALARAVETRDWTDWYAWAAAEKEAIKKLKASLRDDHGFPKADMKMAPYWIDGKPMGGKAGSGKAAVPTMSAPSNPSERSDPSGPSTPSEAASDDVAPPAVEPTGSAHRPDDTEAPAPAASAKKGWRSQAGSELLAPVRGTLRFAAVCQAALSILELVPFLLLVELGRRMLDGQKPEELKSLAITALVILGIATTLTAVLVSWLHVVDARFTAALKKRIVDKLGRLPLGWFTERNSGAVRQVVVEDTAALHYLVTHAVLDAAAAVVTPLVVLIYLFVVDARLAFFLLIPLLAHAVLLGRMANNSKSQITEHGRWTKRIGAETTAYLEGAAVVRTFGDDGASGLRRTLAGYTEFLDGWQVPLGRQKALTAVVTRPTTFLWLIATVGTFFVTAETLSPASLLSFLFLGVTFGPKLLGMAYGLVSYRESVAAAQRIGLALTEPELTVDRDDAAASTPTAGAEPGARGLPVEFRGVEFEYRPGQPVLHQVDLDLPAGQITALVGPSGSGKSTLAALLARFHDVNAGSITIGGTDLRSLPSDELRRRVGFVFQDVRLVKGSVRDNIALARPDATDAEVEAAARAANIHDRIVQLPRGYDTVVGSDVRFSGGEAQRISIARALLADPPVLVLDEATSFADPESERQVQVALSRLAHGRTVLVIAHRLHTIVDADQIVVLEHGRVVERGNHHQLLAEGGRYASMWDASAVGAGR